MKSGRSGTNGIGENTWITMGFEGHHKTVIVLSSMHWKKTTGAGKVAQWVKAFVTRPKNHNSASVTHIAKNENCLQKSCPVTFRYLLLIHVSLHMYAQIHVHT